MTDKVLILVPLWTDSLSIAKAGQILIISKFLNSTGCYRNICIATTAPSAQKYLAEYKEEPHSCID